MNTTILALDLGTPPAGHCAARRQHHQRLRDPSKPQRFEGGGMRFLRFKRWLTDIKQCNDGIDWCTSRRSVATWSTDAAHAYGGFMGQLTAWCEHHQIPYQGVPVGTIKANAPPARATPARTR